MLFSVSTRLNNLDGGQDRSPVVPTGLPGTDTPPAAARPRPPRRDRCGIGRVACLGSLLFLAGNLPLVGQEQAPDSTAFFESRIRPVLVQHCYSCHSAEAAQQRKLQGELYLDTAEGLITGGETGPAIVRGKPAESLLLKALRHEGLEMPPTGKLPDTTIADFTRWIEAGAPDPRQGSAPARPKRHIDIAGGRQFWSFRPLADVSLPTVRTADWSRSPIDLFVAAGHEQRGLQPAPDAAPETWLRRVYFDLIGLPPTPEQLAEFLRDPGPQACERVVDELLSSPHYGERWGRHWLDVVRFAESGGYEFDGFRPGAYHYRDWVIRALNADLPYDEFLRLQLAGDRLRPGYEGAAATGFLVAGPYPGQITAKTVERIRYDQLDDMLMTIGGSMLGLTLGCVRCHEHKYDPIPQQDYYALAASLARTAHGTVTHDPDPALTAERQSQHRTELERRLTALREFAVRDFPGKFAEWRRTSLPQLTSEVRWQFLDALSVSSEDTQLNTADGGLVVVDGPRRKDNDKVVVVAHTFQQKLTGLRLDALTDKNLPRKGPGWGGDGSFALGDLKVVARPLDPAHPGPPVTWKLKPVLAAFEEANQPLKLAVDDNPGTAWRANADTGKDNAALFEIEGGFAGFPGGAELSVELKFAGPGLGRFRLAVTTEPGTVTWAGETAPQHLAELKALAAQYPNDIPEGVRPAAVRWLTPYDADAQRLQTAVTQHQRTAPRPPLVDLYSTVAGGQDVFLLRRGEVDNKQGKAEPGFLQVLLGSGDAAAHSAAPMPPNPTANDPRIALAQWLTDPQHGAGALVARVQANRLWQHHFGRGLVGTPNDFGAQGERPTHPELLEYLAGELVRGGWRLKPLHKQLVLSRTYRLSAATTPQQLQIDPENKAFWHHRPQRLEAEIIRDALLAVGGNLDPTPFGPSVLDNTSRRGIYLRVKRSELVPFLTLFDAPEPTQSIGERISTTVPTQALAMLNSPFVRTQAERLAARVRPAADTPLESALEPLFRLALSRSPSAAERQQFSTFLVEQQTLLGGTAAPQREQALVELCHVLLCSSEFLYVD
ncbi:MAG: PSD1 and planctomycete cytochrome C domain-containing protein [Pirellulales bacterium]